MRKTYCGCDDLNMHTNENQGLVVQKQVNANLALKFNQGFCFSCYKAFALLIFGYSLKAVKVKF